MLSALGWKCVCLFVRDACVWYVCAVVLAKTCSVAVGFAWTAAPDGFCCAAASGGPGAVRLPQPPGAAADWGKRAGSVRCRAVGICSWAPLHDSLRQASTVTMVIRTILAILITKNYQQK